MPGLNRGGKFNGAFPPLGLKRSQKKKRGATGGGEGGKGGKRGKRGGGKRGWGWGCCWHQQRFLPSAGESVSLSKWKLVRASQSVMFPFSICLSDDSLTDRTGEG